MFDDLNHIHDDNHVLRDINKFLENEYIYDEDNNTSDLMRDLTIGGWVAVGLVLLCILLCCCRWRRTRGRVLAPPCSEPPRPYPQQQYVTATVPYPAAPYTPAVAPYAPAAAPYLPAAAPYPPAAGPYPPAAAPYPPAAGPYAPATPYASAPAQPSAPDLHTLPPPSYDQATAYDHTKH